MNNVNISEKPTTITALGRAMACFPVSARYSKMISLAQQHDLLPYVIAIVAALSVPELLIKVDRVANDETDVSAWLYTSLKSAIFMQ